MNEYKSGWLCPRCEKINAPSTPQCFCNSSHVVIKNESPIVTEHIKKLMDNTLEVVSEHPFNNTIGYNHTPMSCSDYKHCGE